MKVLTALLGVLALIQPCFSSEAAEAAEILYFYTVYDLDVKVWGPGHGYVAPDCEGKSLPDGECTLNEFINFIRFGDASSGESYYDLEGGFQFVPGAVAAIVIALRDIVQNWDFVVGNVVKNRKTAVGLWDDLAQIIDADHERAKKRNIGVTRHLTNAATVLGAAVDFRQAALSENFIDHMKSQVKDVIWKTVNKESDYIKAGYNKLKWQATVEANPDLKDPKTDMYKNVIKAVKGFDQLDGTMHDKTMAINAANSFRTCLR